MDLHAAGALVTGYEHLITSLQLPDRDDRHVLAAAIRCKADVIVTANLRDLPSNILDRYGMEPKHPDTFVYSLFNLSPNLVVRAAHDHRESLKNPSKTIDQYLATLAVQGLTRTAAAIRPHM